MNKFIVAGVMLVSILLLCVYFWGLFFQQEDMNPLFYFLDLIPDYFLVVLALPILFYDFKYKFWILAFLFLSLFLASPFKLNFSFKSKESVNLESINVASFNAAQRVNGFKLYKWFMENELDILFVQEAKDRLFDDSAKYGLFASCEHRLCTLSRFPIENYDSLDRKKLGGWGVFATTHSITVNKKKIIIVNTHFSSISNFGYEFSSINGLLSKIGLFIEMKALEFSMAKAIVNKLKHNGRVIIAGDLNITSRNPQYQKHWSDFKNLFDDVGNGYGVTRKHTFLVPRIDHILVSSAFEPCSASIGDDLGSDHLPIVGTIQLTH